MARFELRRTLSITILEFQAFMIGLVLIKVTLDNLCEKFGR